VADAQRFAPGRRRQAALCDRELRRPFQTCEQLQGASTDRTLFPMAQAIYIKGAKMTTTNAQSGIRALSIEDLKVSTTAGQAERRKHFNKVELEELATSIKTVGVLSPILARPVNGHFEIVFGERRFIAAKLAGLTAIDVAVRTLTDEQVLEVQLIENLQREGLHALAEAEGYEKLQQEFGHSAEEIAGKVGKSKGYIYSRLKLCGLAKASRAAFYDGKLTPSTALLLARIPVESLQSDALKAITGKRWNNEVMSFREAAEVIRRDYMTNLADAGFPTEDAALVAAAGACGACPKRTGNQAELFDDVKSGNVCTDPICFKAKRQAHAAMAIAQAKEDGQPVITGADAKKIMPWQHSLATGYSKLTDVCYDDKKQRTYGQLLGKDFKPTLVQNPETGVLVKVVTPAAARQARLDNNIKPPTYTQPTRGSKSGGQSNKLEQEFRESLFLAIHAKAPKKLSRHVLETIIEHELDAIGELPNVLTKAWGWDADTHNLESLTEPQLNQFLFELCVVEELNVSAYAQTPKLLNLAKSMKIDTKKIRKAITVAVKPTKKAKAKKK
jgi:ParB/RepB/Spo0J family partition protein